MAHQKQKKHNSLSQFRSLFSANPLLYKGLALAPAAVACYNLQNAAAISVAMAIVVIPVLLIASLMRQALPYLARMIAYPLLSLIFYIPAYIVVQTLFPQVPDRVGIYLPMVMMDTLLLYQAEHFAIHRKPTAVLLEGVCSVAGFALVVCLLGSVREIFGSGTIWGVPIGLSNTPSVMLLPAMGLILLGFMSAGRRLITDAAKRRRYSRKMQKEGAEK